MDSTTLSHTDVELAALAALATQPPQTARPGGHRRIEIGRTMTPLGPMVVGIQIDPDGDERLVLLEFTDRHELDTQLEMLAQHTGALIMPAGSKRLALAKELRQQLDDYFAGRRKEFELPLAAPGTAFQAKVWAQLERIPYGETRSYADIANAVGCPGGTRAVGTTNGKNRIAIVIPCHRVVRSDGSLSGYAGGTWRKQALLELESGTRRSS